MNRRSFIQLLALAGGAAATGVAFANKESLESLIVDGQFRVSQSQNAIGTHVDITAIGDSQMKTEDAVQAAFADVSHMEQLLTRYGNSSPICELNEFGHLDHIPQEILALYQSCDFFYRDTHGAFDITVKPLIDLFSQKSSLGLKPSQCEIADALTHVGANKIQLTSSGQIRMPEQMGITLDGAAPGFIADRAAQILNNHGIEHFLVNAGGEIRTSGHPKGANAWRIAIQDPAKKGNFPGTIQITQGAVSTSGNYEIFFGNDRLFHHIVDARTGHSPNLASVTVTAPTALEADILSTALFVMPVHEALQYIDAHPQFACFIIDNEGNQTSSKNFRLLS